MRPADAVLGLEDADGNARLPQTVRAGEARDSGSDDDHAGVPAGRGGEARAPGQRHRRGRGGSGGQELAPAAEARGFAVADLGGIESGAQAGAGQVEGALESAQQRCARHRRWVSIRRGGPSAD
jgi:hypothetical protein